tara:strand:+ start:143 stop:586 length:444 start_codon:yes stop_codon:yes gene_type:complete
MTEDKNTRDPENSLFSTESNQKPKVSPIPRNKKSKRDPYIPKEVANRMVRRVVFTTGLPTFSGMGVFIISYLLITKGIADVAPAITLTTSALCFLIGLIGLSYGILSASWEKESGSILGFENIQPNIARMRDAFKTKTLTKTSKKVN